MEEILKKNVMESYKKEWRFFAFEKIIMYPAGKEDIKNKSIHYSFFMRIPFGYFSSIISYYSLRGVLNELYKGVRLYGIFSCFFVRFKPTLFIGQKFKNASKGIYFDFDIEKQGNIENDYE